jgi:hypothetical protein
LARNRRFSFCAGREFVKGSCDVQQKGRFWPPHILSRLPPAALGLFLELHFAHTPQLEHAASYHIRRL